MDNFTLLQQILARGVINLEQVVVNATVSYPNQTVRLTNTVGPISPRTRVVEFTPLWDKKAWNEQVGHQVMFWEVTHGVPQPADIATYDTTQTSGVESMCDKIWAHFKG